MKAMVLTIATLFASAISMGANALDCSNIPAWDSAATYTKGMQAKEGNNAYTANWWSKGNSPSTHSGQWEEWTLNGACDVANHAPVAAIKVTTSNHLAGVLTVGFSGANSTDADGDALTYNWNFGDPTNTIWPNTATGVGVNHLYYAVGTFTVTLTVTDGKGGSNTTTTQVTTYCECSASSIYRSSSSTRTTSSSSSFFGVDSSASSSISSIRLNTPPVARITATTVVLVAGSVPLGVSGSASTDADGDALTYAWDFGDQTSATGVSASHTYAAPGSYTVKLTVSDGKGGVGTATMVASVSPASSSSSIGNGCTSPQYVAGTSYSAGQVVQNAGKEYSCNIAGWCSSPAAWAYAPGTGSYWEQAWSLVRVCGVASSSSSSLSSHSVSSSISESSLAPPSSRSSVSSSSTSSVNLPKHALVGYWHNFNNGSGLIRLADVDNTWDVIVIAFADDSGNGSVAFNLDSGLNKAQFIADVAAKRAAGKKVVLSFGGQNGTVTLNNSTNVTNFVNSTAAIINEYGFDGIDIDLESGAGVAWGAGVVTNLPIAVKQLKAKFPNLYLSMAPEHPYVQGGYIAASGIWGAYLPMIDSLRNELTILHVQLYNNGGLSTPYASQPLPAGSVDFMVGSIKMLIEGFPMANNTTFQGLRPDQVAIGVPSGPRSASSGFVNITDLNNAVNCLAKLQGCGSIRPNSAYPNFRGVMTWSINWDVADGRPFSIPVNNNLKALDIQF